MSRVSEHERGTAPRTVRARPDGRELLGYGAMAVVLLLVLLLNKRGVLAPDIKPEIYLAPWREAEALRWAWRESPKLGEANFNVGLFPVAVLVAGLQALGLDADLSMRVLRWLLLLVGATGAVALYSELVRHRGTRAARLVVALVFVANPYMITAGDFLAVVLPAALLPWLLLSLLRALSGGWRYPALGALALTAMSGMNAGVIPVIQLVALPAVAWYGRRMMRLPWRAILAALARWALLSLLLAAYWLVPSLAALTAGSAVTANSETLSGIAGPSSFAEVARGLGLWPLYGGDQDGPWQPGFAAYLTNPAVVLASFGLLIAAASGVAASRSRVRGFALWLLVPAVLVMVGIHPPASPTPLGRAFLWAFENIPGAAAFRTTNKAGSVMVLGAVLLVGLLVAAPVTRRAWARARVWRPRAAAIAVTTGLVLVLATWPAWRGGLYSLPLPVPGYWYQAAAALDAGPTDERVWFVPGDAQPQYTWSEDRPDDLNNALLARPSFVRLTLPESSPSGANLLWALDTALQEQRLPPQALSAAARYLGVSDLLVRNDVRWDKAAGATPWQVASQVGADGGVFFAGSNGDAGVNVLPSAATGSLDAGLPPLQRYRVIDPRPMVRAEAATGTVLVDGDNAALPPAVQAGLLPGQPPYRLLGEMTAAELAALLGPTQRVLLTDTNRRRTVQPNRLTGADGPLLVPAADPSPSRALFGADEQTVLRTQGGQVVASESGGLFGIDVGGTPENAVDGDPTTAWRFGDYGRGQGATLTVTPSEPVTVDQFSVDAPPQGSRRITKVEVSGGGRSTVVALGPDGRGQGALGGVRAERLVLRVVATDGAGDNPLAVAELAVPGLRVERVARLPLTLPRLLARLDQPVTGRLQGTPLDVLFDRARGTPSASDDEEARLNRDWFLPDARTFRVYGVVRLDPHASDAALDEVTGVGGAVSAVSTSRAFDNPDLRGSRAADGDPNTAWAPGRQVVGESLTIAFPQRALDGVSLVQPPQASGWVSRVRLLVDSRAVAEATVGRGSWRIPLAVRQASSVTVQVIERAGNGVPLISEVDAGGARVGRSAPPPCVEVGTADGRPVTVRAVTPASATGFVVAGCAPLSLAAGGHTFRSVPGWLPDTLVLRDVTGERVVPGVTVPGLRVRKESPSRYVVDAPGSDGPYLLVIGQNAASGWRATMDGQDLGPPVVADGYALGWWVNAAGSHRFEVEYAPQGPADVAAAVSGVAVLAVAGVALLAGRGDRRRLLVAPLQPTGATPPAGAAAATGPGLGRLVRSRAWLTWLLLVAALTLAAGLPGLVTGSVLALWHVARRPQPITVLKTAVAAALVAPVLWVVGNIPRWGEVTPELVLANPWPSWAVVACLGSLVVGVWQQGTGSVRSPQ